MNESILWHQDPPFVADYMNFYLDKTKRILGPHPTDHTKLVILGATNGPIPLKVGNRWFIIDTDMVVDSVADLDTGTLAAGTDYNLYACDNNGTLVFKVSTASTYPSGYTANNSRKIGGFHTLCADVGTISGHTLSGYLQKDILPASIWCLKHRAANLNNRGMTYSESIMKWVQIYLPSSDGLGGVQSIYGATILDGYSWDSFLLRARQSKVKFLSDFEFECIAEGSNQKTNITGSADPVTTGGHVDTAGQRMISFEGIEDCCGVIWQWLNDIGYKFDGATAHTHNVTVSGDPETATTGAPSVDVAPEFTYKTLGDRGNFLTQGTYGEVKFVAGGTWDSGVNAGSWCKAGSVHRPSSAEVFSSRFCVESL